MELKSFHFALEWQTVLLLPVTISVWCHQHQRLIILVDKGKNAAITIKTWMINVGFNMLPGPQTVLLLPKPSFTRLCCTDNGLCIRADHWPKCTLVTKFMLTLPPTTVLQCPYFATFIVHHHKHRGISRKINAKNSCILRGISDRELVAEQGSSHCPHPGSRLQSATWHKWPDVCHPG